MTKFATHEDLKSIARGRLTFDERCVLHRVGNHEAESAALCHDECWSVTRWRIPQPMNCLRNPPDSPSLKKPCATLPVSQWLGECWSVTRWRSSQFKNNYFTETLGLRVIKKRRRRWRIARATGQPGGKHTRPAKCAAVPRRARI